MQELEWSSQVSETDVGVEVDHGIVTLSGSVSSYAKKMAAQEAAHCVSGVLDVANNIQVHIPGDAVHTDTQIASAVRRALEWDALLAHKNIRSTVTSGWVTLEGSVPSLVDKRIAERAVRGLSAVRGVTNDLEINTSSPAPDDVRCSIEAALERRAEREAERIQVTVKDGIVFLTGRVHNWSEKEAVIGAAGFAPGVRRVEDYLRIDPLF